MDKKRKDFLIGLMYNDGDLARLSEGVNDYIGEGFIDFDINRGTDNKNENDE